MRAGLATVFGGLGATASGLVLRLFGREGDASGNQCNESD
jgi:hypothetical protein